MSEIIATLTRVNEGEGGPHLPLDRSKQGPPLELVQNLPPEVTLQRGRYVIGRGKDADICMSIRVNKKEVISRAHAEITCSNNNIFYVSDLNSVNGVFVNGVRIDKQMLYDKDIIQIGGMAKMPTGKKIKQSAENVQYQFCYKVAVPSMIRFAAPPATPPSSRKRAMYVEESPGGDMFNTVDLTRDPFKSGTQAMKGSGVVTSAIIPKSAAAQNAHSSTRSPLLDKDKHQHHKDQREESDISFDNVTTQTSKKRRREKSQERDFANEQHQLQQQENRAKIQLLEQELRDAHHQYEKLRRSSTSQVEHLKRELTALDEKITKKESSGMEKLHTLEKELIGVKSDLKQKVILIESMKADCEERKKEFAETIVTLKHHCIEEKRQHAEQLQSTHEHQIAEQKSELMEETRRLSEQLQTITQLQDAKVHLIAQLEKDLEDKSAEARRLQTSLDQAVQERDEVWVEKMNHLLQTSAEDSRSYKAHIQRLQGELRHTKEALSSCQEQLTTLQREATTASTTTAKAVVSCPFSTETSGSTLVVADGSSSIGVDALREYITCALCQQPMLDAVVCRCSHGFCHACLEVFIRNQANKTKSDKSKYVVHKTLAAIKAGNVSGVKVSSGDGSNSDPYASFTCPVCHHDDEDTDDERVSTRPMVSRKVAPLPYFRSENLDSIIYLCQQASSRADREVFEQREATNFHLLQTLGIDPMASAVDCANTNISRQQKQDIDNNGHNDVSNNDVNTSSLHSKTQKRVGTSNNTVHSNNERGCEGAEGGRRAVHQHDSDSDNDSTAYGNYDGDSGGGSEAGGYSEDE